MSSNAQEYDIAGARDFDFMVGEWQIHNRFKNKEGQWVEFPATNRGEKYLDGCVIIDHYESTVTKPDGRLLKGITIRAFDVPTQKWSIVWLDNRGNPDFRPLVGQFTDGIGLFYQDLTDSEGETTKIRFTWDNITDTTARWQQATSRDGGETWDTNWIMELSR